MESPLGPAKTTTININKLLLLLKKPWKTWRCSNFLHILFLFTISNYPTKPFPELFITSNLLFLRIHGILMYFISEDPSCSLFYFMMSLWVYSEREFSYILTFTGFHSFIFPNVGLMWENFSLNSPLNYLRTTN